MHSIDRRSFLRAGGIGAAGLAGAALIGCGSDEEPNTTDNATTTGGATPASGGSSGGSGNAASGTLRVGHAYPGATLDPNSSALAAIEYHALFDPLVRMNTDGEFEPALADSWELDSQDNTRWVFNLRDAEWSDGVKFTAEDVKFTFEYMMNPDNKSALLSRVGTVESVEIVDEKTVAIKTKGPDAILPRRNFLVPMLPKHFMEDPSKGPQELAVNPVGTGAYVVEEFVQGGRMVFVANPSSWRGNKGVNRAEMELISEDTTRIAAFQQGDLQVITQVPIPEVERVGSFGGAQTIATRAAGFHGWDLDVLNGPTADPRVRMAFNYAIDCQAIADAVYRGTTPIMKGQPLTSATFGHNPKLNDYGFDQDRARELLSEAGFGDGFDTVMEMRSDLGSVQQAHAQAVADYLGQVGVNVTIRPIELNIWREGLYGRAQRAPIFWNTWSSFAIREASFALQWYSKKQPIPYYVNDAWEELYQAAIVEMDEAKRLDLYQQAQVIHHADPSSVWVVEGSSTIAWNSEAVGNVATVGGPDLYLDQLELA